MIDDTEQMVEFFKDGTMIVASRGETLVGSYKFLDKDRIRMEFAQNTSVVQVSISGNTMTLVGTDGMVLELRRVK